MAMTLNKLNAKRPRRPLKGQTFAEMMAVMVIFAVGAAIAIGMSLGNQPAQSTYAISTLRSLMVQTREAAGNSGVGATLTVTQSPDHSKTTISVYAARPNLTGSALTSAFSQPLNTVTVSAQVQSNLYSWQPFAIFVDSQHQPSWAQWNVVSPTTISTEPACAQGTPLHISVGINNSVADTESITCDDATLTSTSPIPTPAP